MLYITRHVFRPKLKSSNFGKVYLVNFNTVIGGREKLKIFTFSVIIYLLVNELKRQCQVYNFYCIKLKLSKRWYIIKCI